MNNYVNQIESYDLHDTSARYMIAPVEQEDQISFTLQEKNISENNTYYPDSGYDGFSIVHVNVPNTFSANDNGKVIQNNALISQTSQTITQNGTYNTTTNNEVVVNVNQGTTLTNADEGKVVQNQQLVPQTSQTITQNGTYDTTTKNQVTINVSSGGTLTGILMGTTIPNNSQGVNNDYYYKYVTTKSMFKNIKDNFSSSTNISGNEFKLSESSTLIGLKGKTRSNQTGSLRLGTLSEILITIDNINFLSDQWVEVRLDSPITLEANTNYIVQIVIPTTPGTIAHTAEVPEINSGATIIASRSGGYPGTSNSGYYIDADIIIQRDEKYITNQYKKINNIWTELEF